MLDVVTIGRVSMDLYAREIGADFADVQSFDAMVGGSPSNIAIGATRLGARVALLTAIGPDDIGRFVLANLQAEGVVTDFIRTVEGTKTGLAILGVQPPDRFPLTFYRENAADTHIDTDDVDALPWGEIGIVELSGTGLSRGTCRAATLYAAERAQRDGATAVLDLDLRPDQWSDRRAYGVAIRSILRNVDVAIGTEEEFHAALASSSPALDGEALDDAGRQAVDRLIDEWRVTQPDLVIVLKRGPRGVTLRDSSGSRDIPGFPVEVVNTVGAGDAFASGFIHGMLQDWDWDRSARYANACGAIEVTRHGCSAAMPTPAEVDEFVEARGGF